MQAQAFHLGVGYANLGPILLAQHASLNPQPCFGLCASDEDQHRWQRSQWATSPVVTDEAEQAVLNWIPFRRACGVVAGGHFQSKSIGHFFLQADLPKPCPAAVTSAGIAENQQLRGFGEVPLARRQPPASNCVHGELGRVGRRADIDETSVLVQHIQAVGHSTRSRVLTEIMRVDFLSLATPRPTLILEIAYQFLLFRVHADHRPTSLEKPFLLLLDIPELPIPIGMWWTSEPLDVDPE
jgi:hypothetical protein